jgi:hypothetical protein
MRQRLGLRHPAHRHGGLRAGRGHGAGGQVSGRRIPVLGQVRQQPLQRGVVTSLGGIQHQPRSVGDLCPLSQHARIMSFSARIPGHDRDMARRGARVDPGAGAIGDLVQDRGDPLVGEAEADPHQVPGPH